MTIEQDAQLIRAVENFVFFQHMLNRLRTSAAAKHFIKRENGDIARMIGVVTGRAIFELALLAAHSEEVGNRNCFIVGYKQAVLRAMGRAPGANAGIAARLFKKDRSLVALLLLAGVFRLPVFMSAPAELGRLQAFSNEAFHRPCVPEGVERLRLLGALGVAFSDMNTLHAGLLHKLRPALTVIGCGFFKLKLEFASEIDERLFHKPRHHAGICSTAGNSGRATRIFFLFSANGLAQRIIGARSIVCFGVKIETKPWLDNRINIESALFAAVAHQIERSGVNRQIDDERLAFAFLDQRPKNLLVIVLGDRVLDEADTLVIQDLAVLLRWINDDQTGLVEFEMAFDQWQGTAPDRPKADHDDRAGNFAIDWPFRFRHFLSLSCCKATALHNSLLRLRTH